MSWLFVTYLAHALLDLFWQSPEDREMERQMLEWCRAKFPKKGRSVHKDADKNP